MIRKLLGQEDVLLTIYGGFEEMVALFLDQRVFWGFLISIEMIFVSGPSFVR